MTEFWTVCMQTYIAMCAQFKSWSGPSFELSISNYTSRCNFVYTRSKIPSFEWSFKLHNLNFCSRVKTVQDTIPTESQNLFGSKGSSHVKTILFVNMFKNKSEANWGISASGRKSECFENVSRIVFSQLWLGGDFLQNFVQFWVPYTQEMHTMFWENLPWKTHLNHD